MLNKAQLAKVQAAAKELRKMYCKKVMEKLCVMMKATLKRLAKHFQVTLPGTMMLMIMVILMVKRVVIRRRVMLVVRGRHNI